MNTLWIVLILLAATRLFGALAVWVKLPVLVGELVAGVALGLIIGWTGDTLPVNGVAHDEHFIALTDLGIFFLMLLGGVEMRPRELLDSRGRSLVIAISAMLLPLLSGFAFAWAWLPESELRFAQSLFVGTALAITAVPATIKVLMDMGLLKTPVGQMIVSAAVFDDILSLILLSVLTAILLTGSPPSLAGIGLLLAKVLFFFAVTFGVGRYLMPKLAQQVAGWAVEEIEFSFLLVVGTLFAIFAEACGLHFILGAFAAGLFFGRQTINEAAYDDVRRKVSAITTGFLAPLFFASIGLHLDLTVITQVPIFLLTLITIAFLGKLLGAAIPAMMMKVPANEAWAIGAAMSSRGAVEMVIAGIALKAGLFANNEAASPIVAHLFSSIVLVSIITTIVAPIGMRFMLAKHLPDQPE